MLRHVLAFSLWVFVIPVNADELAPKAATRWTQHINQSFVNQLPFNNK